MDGGVRERLLLATAGGAQGLALWLLTELWPEGQAARAATVSALTFLAVTALVFHFAWTGVERRRLLVITAATGAVYAAVAAWVGWQLPAEGSAYGAEAGRATTWALTSGVTLYVLGPFLQIAQRTGGMGFSYRALFLHGWNNFFVALVGLLFVGALWAVLLLWAALFDLVGVEIFEDLFSEEAFAYPVTGAAAGFGVALGRESERVVGTLRGITLAVFRGLLPLVSFVALLFLATLPFTGLEGLWDTNHASQLLLTWVALIVLFLNAVYQDGSGRDLPARPLRRLVEGGLLAMIVYLGIAAYGISLRIGQHGLTPERFWGVLVLVVLSAYALGYAGAVVRRGEPWLRAIRTVNPWVALLVVTLGLAAHTPLLDPIGWSARNQYGRLVGGAVPAARFDYGYLRFQLGRAGARYFEKLETLEGHPDLAAIREGVARARQAESYWQWKQARDLGFDDEAFERADPSRPVPPGLLAAVRASADVLPTQGCMGQSRCALAAVELDGNPPEEWLFIVGSRAWSQIFVYAEREGRFQRIGILQSHGRHQSVEEVVEALRSKSVRTEPSEFLDLLVGEHRYRVVE